MYLMHSQHGRQGGLYVYHLGGIINSNIVGNAAKGTRTSLQRRLWLNDDCLSIVISPFRVIKVCTWVFETGLQCAQALPFTPIPWLPGCALSRNANIIYSMSVTIHCITSWDGCLCYNKYSHSTTVDRFMWYGDLIMHSRCACTYVGHLNSAISKLLLWKEYTVCS